MKIIFDNDAATDDIIALIYLVSQKAKIAAITVAGTGEAYGDLGANNMAALCHRLGIASTPIAYGDSKPCEPYGEPFPQFLRDIINNVFDGMDVKPHPHPTISNSAVGLIKSTLEESNEPVTILATGPLTNIAQFLAQHPELEKKIDNIVIMGGAVYTQGNIRGLIPKSGNRVAEWNIYADPKAAAIVFESGIPITLVPLDATNHAPLTIKNMRDLSLATHPHIRLTYKLLERIRVAFGDHSFYQRFRLWDALAAITCLYPERAITEEQPIKMDLMTGQTRPVDASEANVPPVKVAVNFVDAANMMDKFFQELERGFEHTPSRKRARTQFFDPNSYSSKLVRSEEEAQSSSSVLRK